MSHIVLLLQSCSSPNPIGRESAIWSLESELKMDGEVRTLVSFSSVRMVGNQSQLCSGIGVATFCKHV
jgi:hypothetical protein